MAAGDRNKKGEATDFVRHYKASIFNQFPICGTKRYGYSSSDKEDVTCKKCLKKM